MNGVAGQSGGADGYAHALKPTPRYMVLTLLCRTPFHAPLNIDMIGKLNIYGDELIGTTGVHGADIALQRMDDLDRQCLEFILLNGDKRLIAYDIGCGAGIQGMRFAALGCISRLYDIMDITSRVEKFRELFSGSDIEFTCGDIRSSLFSPSESPF